MSSARRIAHATTWVKLTLLCARALAVLVEQAAVLLERPHRQRAHRGGGRDLEARLHVLDDAHGAAADRLQDVARQDRGQRHRLRALALGGRLRLLAHERLERRARRRAPAPRRAAAASLTITVTGDRSDSGGRPGRLVEVGPPARVDAGAVLPVHLQEIEGEHVVAPEVGDERLQERVGRPCSSPESSGAGPARRGAGRPLSRPDAFDGTMAVSGRMTRALRIRLVLALLLVAARLRDAFACDSTGCLLVTRSAGGLLPRKSFRLDLSFRATDDSRAHERLGHGRARDPSQGGLRARPRAPGLPPGPRRHVALPAGGRRPTGSRAGRRSSPRRPSSPTARTTSATRRCSRRTTRPGASATRSSACGTPSSRRPRRASSWARAWSCPPASTGS